MKYCLIANKSVFYSVWEKNEDLAKSGALCEYEFQNNLRIFFETENFITQTGTNIAKMYGAVKEIEMADVVFE